jgi:uncharacterized protein YjgD (DUF1641 family)
MMETKLIEQQIENINKKLDFITGYIKQQERQQREWEELKSDLTVIGKDIFQTAVQELDEVSYSFDTHDLFFLLKKLLRNTRNISRLLDQVESASDFLKDATPLSKQIFSQLLDTLQQLEQKGYFDFGREMLKVLDTVVTSFTAEDVQLFRENITAILMTVKNLTQPQMLGSINNAMHFFQEMDVVVDQKITYRHLMKELRDPELKRGIAFVIQFMKNMVYPNGDQKDQILNEDNNQMKKEEQ